MAGEYLRSAPKTGGLQQYCIAGSEFAVELCCKVLYKRSIQQIDPAATLPELCCKVLYKRSIQQIDPAATLPLFSIGTGVVGKGGCGRGFFLGDGGAEQRFLGPAWTSQLREGYGRQPKIQHSLRISVFRVRPGRANSGKDTDGSRRSSTV